MSIVLKFYKFSLKVVNQIIFTVYAVILSVIILTLTKKILVTHRIMVRTFFPLNYKFYIVSVAEIVHE